jgi:hypothetical protein
MYAFLFKKNLDEILIINMKICIVINTPINDIIITCILILCVSK